MLQTEGGEKGRAAGSRGVARGSYFSFADEEPMAGGMGSPWMAWTLARLAVCSRKPLTPVEMKLSRYSVSTR